MCKVLHKLFWEKSGKGWKPVLRWVEKEVLKMEDKREYIGSIDCEDGKRLDHFVTTKDGKTCMELRISEEFGLFDSKGVKMMLAALEHFKGVAAGEKENNVEWFIPSE